jgi:RNA polymerase sigma-70 factor (ECF subfamily)
VEESLAGEASAELLVRVRGGDRQALEALVARYVPRLRRWVTGRVPAWARDAADTEDLVQDTLVDSLRRLDQFDYRNEGALQAYFRQAVLNRVRSQFRRAHRRPQAQPLDDELLHEGASPLESAIGREMLDRYEAALAELTDHDREMVIARIEMGYSNDELAAIFGKPSRDAARVALARALVRLAEAMAHDR